MRKKISLMLPLLCAPLAFWACGDGESNSGTSANGSVSEADLVVATFDDLPVCSDKREGATAYVKDEKTAYICEDGKWISDDETDGDDSSSSVKPSSSSSDKIDSSSSVKPSSSSSVNPGSSSSKKDDPMSSSSFKYEQDSTAYEQPDVVKVKDKSIAGVSQKGPFVTGSAVKLYELDGETYAQTGKSFTGKITSDNGEFGVSSVTLASQYALLEASGYYRNEVSGKKSGGTITLNALTDLSDREKVNINLLTHLEYERALYLVGTGVNVPAAKKQAEAEIFNAFGIQGDFANSEDLNIFSKGEGNAALLAFSILMQGNRSEAELTELLTKFATDIEKDGEWNDASTKAKIADWANEQDLNGKLSSIRSNINSWGLGSAPDFEKYVRNFWYANYGLEACEADSKGVVAATTNELVEAYGTKTRYICNGEGWVEASDIEKDTYQWAAGEDGEIKQGSVTKSVNYVYDGAKNAWRNASTVEAALGGCTETREADISLNTGKVNGTWYICKNRKWESTNNITVDTQGWVEGSDGDIKKGDSTDVQYKYDEALDQWVATNANDVSLGLMGCTTNRTGEIGKSGETYYVCKNSNWQVAAEIDYDTYGEKCTSAEVGKTMNGKETATNKYYCSSKGWVSLMGDWTFDVPKEARLNPEITYGTMTDKRDYKKYKTVKIGDQVWMAENLNYADSTKMPSLKGKSWCYDDKAENCDVTGRLYTWAAAIDSVALANDADNPQTCGYGKTCTLPTVVQGVCPEGWHLPSYDEWETLFKAVGGFSAAGKALKSGSGWYSNGNGTDTYGFSALPAGYRNNNGNFYNAGNFALFWSASENDSYNAYYMYLGYFSENAYMDNNDKYYGSSVRCLQN
ncbi:fibrobacter succinogenes major paralogous domain-containing protein [Fibrobacter sp. UWEL]|uniref:fibrobacter succinogenes major paralogous domain-containing protein n=1 Tax=Fibrobacter sp. UWEL TaxID=1896209 RepID=UPI0009214F23|nr:fibrobacter succinogenes major paralogous domain-containing protein [Fibrobacter sp. UWEL]SHL55516.1 major paralogous domain-containing protein [Fibrobacter sp. UWEL]